LRKKLAQAGADNLIGTVWGRGYMIREPTEAEVEPVALEPRQGVGVPMRPFAA